MVMAYVAFALAFLCFFAGIAGWRPWLRWQRFPNITVCVDSFGNEIGSEQTPGGLSETAHGELLLIST